MFTSPLPSPSSFAHHHEQVLHRERGRITGTLEHFLWAELLTHPTWLNDLLHQISDATDETMHYPRSPYGRHRCRHPFPRHHQSSRRTYQQLLNEVIRPKLRETMPEDVRAKLVQVIEGRLDRKV